MVGPKADIIKGPSINDVTLERGRGVTQSVTNSTDRLRECVTRGGVQKTQKFA